MIEINYNPDVLSCLANLSNDEVFTPPAMANQILDQLPAELWSNKNTKFLDPVCKSGVFLREIAKRLVVGLEEEFPDVQERVNHIFGKQLFGIAITELTALLSRRSVYCSKNADSDYSVCTEFNEVEGNIRFDKIEHKWKKGRCIFCGAGKDVHKRDEMLETHAYQLIHTDKPESIFDMKFDVIIGNPPYQLNDGGAKASASPIYHKFVQQAKKLNPRYLSMITPSRWFGGGKGLGEFRAEMLNDPRIRKITDFENAGECFPGVDIAGGVSFFLWDRDNPGDCEITNTQNGNIAHSIRPLNEFPAFIRHSEAVPIVRNVLAFDEPKMNTLVTSRKPFGLATNVRPQRTGDIILRWQSGEGPYGRSEITVGTELIDKWKVITSYVGYDHAGNPGKDGRRRVFSKIDVLPPGTICNETYLVIGSFETKEEAVNLIRYMKSKFFRFLVSQFMYSHHITKESYGFVPILDMTKTWTDELLADRYGLNREQVDFIDSKIKPMDMEFEYD